MRNRIRHASAMLIDIVAGVWAVAGSMYLGWLLGLKACFAERFMPVALSALPEVIIIVTGYVLIEILGYRLRKHR